jgi:hypothetical protein
VTSRIVRRVGGGLPASEPGPPPRGAWTPTRWIGAPGGLGLRLPDAHPHAHTLYAPRGVCRTPQGGLVVADTGNHRVLIWRSLPQADHAPADLVLGQSGFEREGPQAGGEREAAFGLHLPTGVLVDARGRFFVCDAWNHRILMWNQVPESDNGIVERAPDLVVGQRDLVGKERNAGGAITAMSLDCPYGAFAFDDGTFVVADTGNRRVLVFDALPDVPREGREGCVTDAGPADAVLGQDDFEHGEENRGRGPGADTFRWPHAFAVCGRAITDPFFVADAGNHRVVGWRCGLAAARAGAAPDVLIGQEAFDRAFELPHVPQGPARLRFPYAIAADAARLLVADTANNRVLEFARTDLESGVARALDVLGQHDFDKGGENRWDTVTADTLCWPYGLDLTGDVLTIADSGNNRVTIWSRHDDGCP